MKILFFDLRESEKPFFERNTFCDFDITFREEALSEKTKLSEAEFNNTYAISVYRSSILSEKILSKFKNLRVIITRSHGFSHIDLNYCTKNRITVINTEQYGEKAVAEYALGLILMLTRNIKSALFDIKENKVDPKKYEGELLDKKSIGIIGCGKVGKELAKIANYFDMKVYVSSYKDEPNFDKFCNVVPFDLLLKNSDIIFLHMPFTTDAYQILGRDEFERMKDGVYVINTSSVELIDLETLYANLKSGKVRGAALDILESDYTTGRTQELGNETMSTKLNNKITENLLKMPNVIITPHIAYNTVEYIDWVLETTMNSLKDYIKGNNTNKIC